MAALVRPSVLAKAWGIHPRTVTAWLRTGKLPAVKTPGEHYRVRAEDVVAFCEAEGLPMPAAASPRELTVLLAKRGNLDIRPLRRALRPLDVEVVVTTSGAGALLAVATSPPRALVLDALLPGMDVLEALLALAAASATLGGCRSSSARRRRRRSRATSTRALGPSPPRAPSRRWRQSSRASRSREGGARDRRRLESPGDRRGRPRALARRRLVVRPHQRQRAADRADGDRRRGARQRVSLAGCEARGGPPREGPLVRAAHSPQERRWLAQVHEPPDPRDQPLPPAARPQPGELVRVGRRGLRHGEEARATAPSARGSSASRRS